MMYHRWHKDQTVWVQGAIKRFKYENFQKRNMVRETAVASRHIWHINMSKYLY